MRPTSATMFFEIPPTVNNLKHRTVRQETQETGILLQIGYGFDIFQEISKSSGQIDVLPVLLRREFHSFRIKLYNKYRQKPILCFFLANGLLLNITRSVH
jgi:hypothetical protein